MSDHGGTVPGEGSSPWRSEAPCAHASWLPTRTAAQTTGSLVACLRPSGPTTWATGTSAPCLSVFKPAPLDAALFAPRPVAEAKFDAGELWWRHERLHRACLRQYAARRVTFAEERERFQDQCLRPAAMARPAWEQHGEWVDRWLQKALAVKTAEGPSLQRMYWSKQSRFNVLPTSP